MKKLVKSTPKNENSAASTTCQTCDCEKEVEEDPASVAAADPPPLESSPSSSPLLLPAQAGSLAERDRKKTDGHWFLSAMMTLSTSTPSSTAVGRTAAECPVECDRGNPVVGRLPDLDLASRLCLPSCASSTASSASSTTIAVWV